MAADLGWTVGKVSKYLREVLEQTGTHFDENRELVLIVKHLKHDPIHNENQAKFAIKSLDALPDTPLFSLLLEAVIKYCPPKENKDNAKQFRERLKERLAKPIPDTIHYNSLSKQKTKAVAFHPPEPSTTLKQNDDFVNESTQGGGGSALASFEGGQPPPALTTITPDTQEASCEACGAYTQSGDLAHEEWCPEKDVWKGRWEKDPYRGDDAAWEEITKSYAARAERVKEASQDKQDCPHCQGKGHKRRKDNGVAEYALCPCIATTYQRRKPKASAGAAP